MTIEVIVADDQPLMRAAIRACLDAEPDLTVVAEAGDGETAVRLAEQLRPDVVVMDVRMPVMSGIEATRRIVGLNGEPPDTGPDDDHVRRRTSTSSTGYGQAPAASFSRTRRRTSCSAPSASSRGGRRSCRRR